MRILIVCIVVVCDVFSVGIIIYEFVFLFKGYEDLYVDFYARDLYVELSYVVG